MTLYYILFPSRKGYVTVLGGQDNLHAYGLTPKAQIRRLGKFKVIQGTQVLIGKNIFLNLEYYPTFVVCCFLLYLCSLVICKSNFSVILIKYSDQGQLTVKGSSN